MPLTFSQAEVDAFKAAMLKNPGVTLLRIGDIEYRFDSIEKLREHLAYMQRNVAPDPTVPSGAVRYARTSKGF